MNCTAEIARSAFYGIVVIGGLGGIISLAIAYHPATALMAVVASALVSLLFMLILAGQERFRAVVRHRPLFNLTGMTAALLANAVAFSSVTAYLAIVVTAICLHAAHKVFGQAAVTLGGAATQ
ncbi:hypothetical protein [Arthrobacter sp. H14]|uniref:hypothetical protein n=1 Tax=Arthrobacter sp. H14 TaxID=1312959 RepID=UPI00047A1F31|nr:hypothetical protein [Arthrobacter sp. H14]